LAEFLLDELGPLKHDLQLILVTSLLEVLHEILVLEQLRLNARLVVLCRQSTLLDRVDERHHALCALHPHGLGAGVGPLTPAHRVVHLLLEPGDERFQVRYDVVVVHVLRVLDVARVAAVWHLPS
jgi:hypothetical protein